MILECYCLEWLYSYLLPTFLLKIHHSFSKKKKYWLLLCLFLPPFHFSFMIKCWLLLSCLFLQRFLFWCLSPNYYKSWPLKTKKGVWGGSALSEAEEKKIQFSNSISAISCIFLWREGGLSEGVVSLQKLKKNAIFKLNLHGYTSLFRHAARSTSF